jgi:hypothetical protein
MVGFIGFVFLPGHGKTPKVYYLKRKGFDLLWQEKKDFDETFSEIHKETAWTPAMYHRLKTIELMLSAEIAIQKRPHLQSVRVLLEYRLVKKGASVVRESRLSQQRRYQRKQVSSYKVQLFPDASML